MNKPQRSVKITPEQAFERDKVCILRGLGIAYTKDLDLTPTIKQIEQPRI